MKLTLIFNLLVFLAFGNGFSQSKVTLQFEEATIQEVLKILEDQTGNVFLYKDEIFDPGQKYSVDFTNEPFEAVLQSVCATAGVEYEVRSNRQIILTEKGAESVKSITLQQRTVTGTVTDPNGQPLPGVTVVVAGTTTGTVTNANGNFTLAIPENAQTLQFSFVGMRTQDVQIGGRTSFTVVMEEETIGLEEVVAIGYGVQKKRDVTGALVSVGADEINSRPVKNAIEAIQGKAAGVDITSNERPGTVGGITIRGVRSLTASNAPLYVVDGIPLVTSVIDAGANTSNRVTLGGIDNLNPNDIESIDILKDASATAIYGSRGANGVVLITTKQGQAGKFTLTFDSSVTTEEMHEYSPLFSAAGYVDYRRWAKHYENPQTYPRGDQPTQANDALIFTGDETAFNNILKGWEGGSWDGSKLTTTNWTDLVTRTGITTQNTLSASGGSAKMRAYGSFGYTDNTGVVKGQSYDRYNANVSIDITPVDWFTFGGNLSSSYSVQEYGQSTSGNVAVSAQTTLYQSAYGIFTYALPYDDAGNRIENPGGDIAVKTIIDEDKYSQDQRTTLRAFGSLYGQIDFGGIFPVLDGLRFRTNFGPNIENWRDGIYTDGKSVIRSGSSYASLEKRQRLSYTLDNLIYYDKILDRHNFGLTLLHSQTKFEEESSFMNADNIPLPSQKWNSMGSVSSLRSWRSGIVKQALLSYMARLNYSFNDKYLLTVSGRYDGASQLAEGHKWAFFPSLALGWRIDEEAFMDNAEWINQLKLRFGVGVTGNSAISPYSTKGRLDALFYPFGSSSTAGQQNVATMANQELGWEKTTQYNAGLDFSLIGARVFGSLDVYFSNTTDLLLQKSIPTITGFSNTFANIGETKSNGIDLTLNTVNVSSANFEWTTNFNLTFQQNEIVSLANGKEDDLANLWFIGESQDIIYEYEAAGIWQESDAAEMAKFNANGHTFTAGNVRPVDQNGDYVIDANNDRIIIGNEIPKYLLGLTNTFNYRGLELSVFLYGRMGYTYNAGGEGLVGRYQQRKVDYYTAADPVSDYQKPIYSAGYGDQYFRSLGFENGSFLKIRNVSLGYNFSNKFSNRLGLTKLRVYVQAVNPGFVFNNVPWIDLDVRYHASNRGFVTGINVQF